MKKLLIRTAALLAAISSTPLCAERILPSNTDVPLITLHALSSKTSAKGDVVTLETAADVVVNNQLFIPRGTAAVGEVAEVRQKGVYGQNGKIAIRPLYVRYGDVTVRLTGTSTGEKGTTETGAVVGILILTPAFTGRSATIPAGTTLKAYVARSASFSDSLIVPITPSPASPSSPVPPQASPPSAPQP